jgi:HlyD family secretion protein
MGTDAIPDDAGEAGSNTTAAQKPVVATPDATDTPKQRPAWSASTWWKLGVAALVTLTLVAYLMRNVVLGTPTAVYAATSGELVQSVVASGRVISPQRVNVALQGTGRVVRVAVVEGQTVQQGELLIELDNSDSLATLAQATADVAQAQARLRQLGELNHPQAAQALAQAQANATQALKALERNRTLVGQGFISPAALDEAQRAVDVATSGVASARAMAYSSTPRGSDTALAQAALAQAVAGRQLANAKVAQGKVLAPSSGVLISREVEVGDIVQPGKALMVLASSGQTQLLIQIDEKNLAKIALEQPALGSADAYASQRFDAVVTYINPGVDATRGSVEVKLAVGKPPPYLRQDMTVSVDIETARRTAAVVIATSTLEDADTDKPWVLVVRDKHAVKQFVTLGLRGDTRVEVLDGISAGEGVIPRSKLGVKAGQRVRARVQDVPPLASAPAAGKSPVAP